ncbi:MAG TPA: DNA/RNA nuclease SfsA [Thermoplasmataceae archaeon]|nr:DNA/RNA nuclease SfsA [Thermoplasmataceae archaeon]
MESTHICVGPEPGKSLVDFDWDLLEAAVVERPNRFVVIANLGGESVKCHLHDPGRLKELIFPGNRIRIRRKPSEKTDYSVVCALDGDEWVLIDSRFHPSIARKFLPDNAVSEVRVGRKRIDFKCENEFIEVKGCTLVDNGTAKFPDAPSLRATEHVRLLTSMKAEGTPASIMFLVMRKNAECFVPNRDTDPEFAEALLRAVGSGVNIVFKKMHLDGKSIIYDGQIQMCQ